MTRLIRLFMVAILLLVAAARPAMAQSILRDSETELLFHHVLPLCPARRAGRALFSLARTRSVHS